MHELLFVPFVANRTMPCAGGAEGADPASLADGTPIQGGNQGSVQEDAASEPPTAKRDAMTVQGKRLAAAGSPAAEEQTAEGPSGTLQPAVDSMPVKEHATCTVPDAVVPGQDMHDPDPDTAEVQKPPAAVAAVEKPVSSDVPAANLSSVAQGLPTGGDPCNGHEPAPTVAETQGFGNKSRSNGATTGRPNNT